MGHRKAQYKLTPSKHLPLNNHPSSFPTDTHTLWTFSRKERTREVLLHPCQGHCQPAKSHQRSRDQTWGSRSSKLRVHLCLTGNVDFSWNQAHYHWRYPVKGTDVGGFVRRDLCTLSQLEHRPTFMLSLPAVTRLVCGISSLNRSWWDYRKDKDRFKILSFELL